LGVQRFGPKPLEEATTAATKLNEIALVTGHNFDELSDVFGRMALKEEVSLKDLAKLKSFVETEPDLDLGSVFLGKS
jgi:hypothetical protein